MISHTLGLWFLYRIVMRLKKNAATLKKEGGWKLYLSYLFASVSLILDVLYNLIWGTVMFLQLPHWQRLTFTARLKHIRRGNFRWDWQLYLATYFCQRLLNRYDNGKHC